MAVPGSFHRVLRYRTFNVIPRFPGLAAVVAAVALGAPVTAFAQSALSGSPGQLLTSPSNAIDGGVAVVQVTVTLRGTTGSPEGDAAMRTTALESSGFQAGQMADTAALMVAAQRIRKVDGVTDAAYEVKVGPAGGSVTFLVSVGEAGSAREPTALPKLYEDGRSMVKLIFNGGSACIPTAMRSS